MILTYGGYAVQCLAVYVILGIAWYFFDSIYGVKLYRWLYDIGHKEPMPTHVVRGFMYQQSTKRQVRIATVISTAQSLYMIWGHDVNVLVELILWLLEIPAMLIGVALGNPLFRLFQRRDRIFDSVDKAKEQARELDLETIRETTESFGGRLLDRIRSALWVGFSQPFQRRRASSSYQEVTPTNEEPKMESPPPEDWREILRKYTGR